MTVLVPDNTGFSAGVPNLTDSLGCLYRIGSTLWHIIRATLCSQPVQLQQL